MKLFQTGFFHLRFLDVSQGLLDHFLSLLHHTLFNDVPSLFIMSPIEGTLGCAQFLMIINSF